MHLDSKSLRPRLLKIRALVLDVDGVLTDAGMYYGPDGEALKKFNTRDGMGLRLVREAGISVAWITSEDSAIVRARARKLKIRHLYGGIDDKLKALKNFMANQRLAFEHVAYVGDDLNDLGPLNQVGLAVTVPDADPAVLRVAHCVTRRRGGDGAVREVCNALLSRPSA
jgi:YrbI family 3-deoxy-D-manno-octulosonate 8-phosphate phosphatase